MRFLRPAHLAGTLALLSAAGIASAAVVTLSTRAFQLLDDTQPPINQSVRKFSYISRTLADAPGHHVVSPVPGSAGDPTVDGATGGGAVMTIYNANGSGESFTYNLPAIQWRHEGSLENGRFVYFDATNQPVYKIFIKREKITIRGGRGAWGYTLDEASQGKLALTLTLGTGDTWCIEAVPRLPASNFDRRDRFLAKTNTPPPAVCPTP